MLLGSKAVPGKKQTIDSANPNASTRNKARIVPLYPVTLPSMAKLAVHPVMRPPNTTASTMKFA